MLPLHLNLLSQIIPSSLSGGPLGVMTVAVFLRDSHLGSVLALAQEAYSLTVIAMADLIAGLHKHSQLGITPRQGMPNAVGAVRSIWHSNPPLVDGDKE